MRIFILALFLFAGSTAFGQSGRFGPLSLNPPGSLPSPWTAQGRDFGKLPPDWPTTMNTLNQTVIEPPPPTRRVPLGDAQIDPKIILHPSQLRIGVQPPGTQIAQNLYPGLTFQQIDGQQSAEQPRPSKLNQLSTTWPNMRIKPIPTVWPNLKMEPVDGSGEASSFPIPSPQK